MRTTYAKTTRRKCECGELAPYLVDCQTGPPHNVVRLHLCQSCYIIHLEMELDALVTKRSRLSDRSLSPLGIVIRRYIRLERQNPNTSTAEKSAYIDEALIALDRT